MITRFHLNDKQNLNKFIKVWQKIWLNIMYTVLSYTINKKW